MLLPVSISPYVQDRQQPADGVVLSACLYCCKHRVKELLPKKKKDCLPTVLITTRLPGSLYKNTYTIHSSLTNKSMKFSADVCLL